MRSATILGLIFAAVASTVNWALAAETPTKPDVLFIAIDDLNDWVGHLGGHPDMKTPQIDRLAARGVSFANAHCAAPACNPSRAALLSGLRPSATGVYTNRNLWQDALADVVTLPQFFMAAGYQVIGGGKIFHHGGGKTEFWDEYYQRKELPRPEVPYNGLDMAHFDWGPVDADEAEMPDYKLVSWAAEQLNRRRDKPMFLAVGIVKPHLPWYVPKKYFEIYSVEEITLPEVPNDDLNDIPPEGLAMARPERDHKAVIDAGQWRQAVQAYLATITFVDDQVGRLLDALDRSPKAANTIIVLWGDHGWHLGEKHHWRKFSLWEEATRAPLIFAGPGVVSSGQQCPRPVDFLAVYPTLADLCGLDLPDHLQGISLGPLLKDPDAKWDGMALTTHGRGKHGVRSERWRYIRYSDSTEELYDHAADPMEWNNLAHEDEHGGLKRELRKRMPTKEAAPTPTRPKRS
jgi:arylsulfatase A-like enzyme